MARGESAGAADVAKHHARAQGALHLGLPVGGDRTSKFHSAVKKVVPIFHMYRHNVTSLIDQVWEQTFFTG